MLSNFHNHNMYVSTEYCERRQIYTYPPTLYGVSALPDVLRLRVAESFMKDIGRVQDLFVHHTAKSPPIYGRVRLYTPG